MDIFPFFRHAFTVILSTAFALHVSFAQNNPDTLSHLRVTAQLRPRAELRSGTFQPLAKSDRAAFLISQRSRLTMNYQYKNILTLQFSPQNISIWGQNPLTQTATSNNNLAFFEAWAKLRLSADASLQIGRQVISLDDERFFGALDWAQGARAHDAVSFQFQKNKLVLRAQAAFSQNYKELYGNNLGNVSGALFTSKDAAPYKWMQNVWLKYQPDQQNSLSFLISNLGFQNAKSSADLTAGTYFTQTAGVNYFHSGGQWKYQSSAYYQAGKNQQGISTRAYLAAVSAERLFHSKWSFILGGDWLSGNPVDGSIQKDNHAFNPYFGTNHKFYGSMDYYYAGNAHRNAGLGDIYLKARHTPDRKWTLALAAHQFIAPVKLNNGGSDLSSDLGQEFDLDFNYSLHPYLGLSGGYSVYAVTPSVHFLKGIVSSASLQHWAWCTLNINPEILKLKF